MTKNPMYSNSLKIIYKLNYNQGWGVAVKVSLPPSGQTEPAYSMFYVLSKAAYILYGYFTLRPTYLYLGVAVRLHVASITHHPSPSRSFYFLLLPLFSFHPYKVSM